MLNRHEYRERLVFVLYQHLLLDKDLYECFRDTFEDDDDLFINTVVQDLHENEEKYIEEIGQYLKSWTFDRLNYIEQAILLVAVSEMKLGINDRSVIIDEAVILAKEYCDEESYKYINGVLDNICSS
ncbi:MAG: transcription antitermination factor NusB [Erysipelotrichaceae bacterium]|nr:transcription antitermination factor NusB [Erysipelotrichaceae bacterium]